MLHVSAMASATTSPTTLAPKYAGPPEALAGCLVKNFLRTMPKIRVIRPSAQANAVRALMSQNAALRDLLEDAKKLQADLRFPRKMLFNVLKQVHM